MTDLQVRARTPLDIVNINLSDLIALPDEKAAPALNERMAALDLIHKIHERSYAERGIIAREFERRKLWQYLIDPDTQTPFASLTAWMSCSDFLGCRRVNFEAKRDMEILEDVPSEKLIDVPKSNIKVLTQLSTKVRNEKGVLQDAKDLPQNKFLEKLEQENPDQHLELRKSFRLNPGRSDARVIDKWVEYAIEHDIAGSATEAIVRACEIAIHDAELDEELRNMKDEEVKAG